MTFCKKLAEKTQGEKSISAWEETEKFCTVSNYAIYKAKNGIVYETIKCAKSTWKKRFNETDF